MALLTHTTDDSDSERVYFTRLGTVVSYVEATRDGRGITAVVEPGFIAFPEAFAQAADSVRDAMLREIAGRLGIYPAMVLAQPLRAVIAVADPLYQHDPWSARGRSRGRRR